MSPSEEVQDVVSMAASRVVEAGTSRVTWHTHCRKGLNAWQPEYLVVSASMARVLAEEQLAGRLRISSKAVMCSSEVLTGEAIVRVEHAWGSRPFNVYVGAEPMVIVVDVVAAVERTEFGKALLVEALR